MPLKSFSPLGLAFLLVGCANYAILYSGPNVESSIQTAQNATRIERDFGEGYILDVVGCNYMPMLPLNCGEELADWLAGGDHCYRYLFRPASGRSFRHARICCMPIGEYRSGRFGEKWMCCGNSYAEGVPHRSSIGPCGMLNNALSTITLSIWPQYDSNTTDYIIIADFGDCRRETQFSIEQREFWSWLPLGYVPVFAWADAREYGTARDDTMEKIVRRQVRKLVLDLFVQDATERVRRQKDVQSNPELRKGHEE